MILKNLGLRTKLAQLHIMFMPFISAFPLNPWLPLPLLFMIFVSLYLVLSSQLKIFKDDIEIWIVIALGIVGMLFTTDYLGVKNINHVLAISISVIFFYVAVKSLLIDINSIYPIAKAFSASLFFVSCFILFEFIAYNFLHINLLNYIPYTRNDLADASVFGILIRPRGFAEEAGHMALYYELTMPISLLYFKKKPLLIKISYYLLVITSFILLFSAAALVAIALASLIGLLIRFCSKKSIMGLTILSTIAVIVLSSDVTQIYLSEIVGSRLEIFADSSFQSNISAIDRSSRYQNAIQFFLSAPFGIGWGTVSQLATNQNTFAGILLDDGGLISLYAEVLVASGFLGLIMFLIFMGKKMLRIVKLKSFESQLIFISLLSLSLHYIFISNYWFPMLWLALALADTVYKLDTKGIKTSFPVS